jgi:hypothetical protein
LAKRFQRRRLSEIDLPEARIAYDAMFVNEPGANKQFVLMTFHMLPTGSLG